MGVPGQAYWLADSEKFNRAFYKKTRQDQESCENNHGENTEGKKLEGTQGNTRKIFSWRQNGRGGNNTLWTVASDEGLVVRTRAEGRRR